ncbi:acyl-(acyl-carrier-protein)--UDP-N-acetylglucosamine O-acyltransferase [Saprospira grandis DSM 2844]|uniref:Acyl-(Acyl-carrier-protein)--UDP-N-acetylglucosamine O-acyltransferase n=1 Tax=Saprospira grandis DSM 2844 TaxID=694433 RepID=J0XWX6_9BACT|nr:acyl-ACP--UDP-N-acetylglucosamine O-acyltransferase [Saprospira grandis]EJF53571.1 acyl-(acyl-carrier-protein)--UDP-N-acetylglucosamine O-acyltransferase [Saprospira grandis DSM 2844]
MNHHPLAAVSPKAKIGKNVKISPFVTIEEDVVIGDGTQIGPNAVIMSGSRIGQNCQIFPGAIIGAAPQDLKFKGEYSTLEVGDNTIIREYCTLNRGTAANEKTVVGSNCLLMAYVHIAHDCIVGNHCVLANNSTLAGHVELEDYVILGGMSAVHQFTRIGAHAMLGGGVLLNKDVPPFVRVAHYPASYIGVNVIGLKRRGFSVETIESIQEIYHQLFVIKQSRADALSSITALTSSTEREQILQFVEGSEIGIVKGLRSNA